ncbi:metabotropic glycine receptor isoform X2 [Anguilla rostrata]|uniref:metabotropic glycine receptor isoform X2 n=1 Tax=Anguilla rostrata TaxID=7938 RepID=UPI0030D29B89
MDGLAVLLVLLPLSAQVTPVMQREVRFSPIDSEGPMENERGKPLSGSLSPSVSPSMEPLEEDEWAPVEAYLYNANATLLAQANCSRAYRLPGLQGVPAGLRSYLSPALDALTNTANFLNMIFQTNDLRESSVTEDMEWYHALVRGLLEGNPLIRRALLTFDAQPAASRPQLVLRASRTSCRSQDILLQDLSSAWELMHPPPPAPDASWFTALKFPELPQQAPSLSKRLLLNDLRTLTTPKWGRGDSYVTNQDGVRWADAPFLECEGGRFVPDWLLTLSTSFYGLKPDLSPEFRGVIRVDVSLQSFDLDQCAKGKDWFSNTHQCNRTSMQCEPTNGQGFRLGQYSCHCKKGYYSPTTASQDTCVAGHSASHSSGLCALVLPVCLPCWPGCLRCEDGSPCKVQEDWYLRAAVLTVQGFFMFIVFISMLVTYQFRRNKRIHASGLLLLETILFGSVLLYFPVFILYFKPSTFRCILLRWVRLLGFAIVYGTVTLKMYRVLKVFLSHTAQRVSYMSSMQLLRQLGVIILTVSWFLSAWTAGALQNRDRNVPLLITSTTSEGQSFTLCDLDRWDYMMALAEVLFLIWSSFLCNAVRTVPSAFHEPRYMGIAIHNELLLSSGFHLLRFAMPSLHPDWMLLLFFTHTHVTVTVTLGLLFIPKPLREEIAAEVYEDEVDLRCSGSYLNSSFTSAWSEHSLDPDDIRDELKKLYSQLEIHKTKKMTTNNPHLQKKRISRRTIGLSIMKRITQIPESMSRQCSCENKERSLVVGRGSYSGSFNKNKVLESSSIRFKEESKHHGLSIHKSQSTHDYVRDHQFYSRDTKDPLVRKSLSNKASVNSDTESMDNVPLVYKSASAHNLSSDKKLQLEPNKLQKSLSVMTKNNMSTSLHPNKTSSLEYNSEHSRENLWERDHSEYNATIRTQTTNALLSGSFDKECHLPENKSQKHVTYALSQDSYQGTAEKVQSPSSQQSLISPWNTFPHDPPRDNATLSRKEMQMNESKKAPPRTGNEESDSDSESKPKIPVSSSAPGSPLTAHIRQKDHRVSSCYGPPCSFSLSVKGLVRFGKASEKNKNKNASDHKEVSPKSLKTVPKIKTVPVMSDNKEKAPIVIPSKSPPQQRSVKNDSRWEVEGTKPCLVKQAAIRVSSNESQEADTKKQKSLPGGSCICPQEKLESEKIKSPHFAVAHTSKNSHDQNAPAQMSVNTEVCPKPFQHKTQRQQSSIPDIYPCSVKESNVSSVKKDTVRSASVGIKDIVAILRQRSTHANICPWDVQDREITTKRQASDCTNMCPWESEEPKKSISCQQSVYADICPWEMQEQTPDNQDNKDKKDKNIHATVMMTTKKLKERDPPFQNAVKTEVCPWDVPDPCKQTPQRQQSIVADVCPWDVPDPCKQTPQRQQSIVADVCPWDVPDPCKQTPQRKQSIVADVCPWDVPDPCKQAPQRKQSIVADVCPWDAPDPCKQMPQRQQGVMADVCCWDVEDQDKTKRQESSHTNIFSSNFKGHNKPPISQDSDLASICPWETQDYSLSKEDQWRAECNLKPTITAATKIHLDRQMPSKTSVKSEQYTLEVLESSQPAPKICLDSIADVCPWDLEEPREQTKRQKSLHTGICPWETQGIPSESSQKEVMSSKHTLLTSLKKSGDQILPIDTSMKAEVCPWDIPKSSQLTSIQQHGTIGEVCPWDVEENNLCQEKQSTVRSSLESVNEAEKTKHHLKSGHEDICPWELEETETTKGQESVISKQSRINTDMCQPQALPNMVNICPWDTEDIKPCLVKQASIRLSSDEPLEATSNKLVLAFAEIQEMEEPISHDYVRADICPWETEETKEKMEKQEHIFANICPWEAQSPEKIEAERSTHAEVCPWERKEQEKAKEQERVNADVCPWETEEVRSEPVAPLTTKQSSDREMTGGTTNQWEIDQREMDKQSKTTGDETGAKAPEPSKRERNSNQPIVSLSQKIDGDKSSLTLSCNDAVCSWEIQEVKPALLHKEDSNSDIPPWECEDTVDDNDAESAAEAFFFPADL